MLDKNQARSKFRSLLLLILVGFFWPIIGLILGFLADFAGVNNTALLVLSLTLAWLGLFVWLFIDLWRTAGKINVTPWASLWLFLPVVGIFLVGMLILEPLKYIADDKPENKKLPYTWVLIKETWKSYADNFTTSIKISSWFLYLFIIFGILTALVAYWNIDWLPVFTIIFMIPVIICTVWISLILLKQQIDIENGQKTTLNLKNSFQELLSYLWITILMILLGGGPLIIALLMVIVPLITGNWQNINGIFKLGFVEETTASLASMSLAGITMIGLLLMIPAWIWLIYKTTVWNSLAMPLFMTEKIKGYTALKECEKIAKGRWWGLFWKNQMSGMIFGAYGLMISLGMNIAAVIIALILRSLNLGQASAEFLGNALNGVVQMVIMPLFIVFTLKLYKGFRKSS